MHTIDVHCLYPGPRSAPDGCTEARHASATASRCHHLRCGRPLAPMLRRQHAWNRPISSDRRVKPPQSPQDLRLGSTSVFCEAMRSVIACVAVPSSAVLPLKIPCSVLVLHCMYPYVVLNCAAAGQALHVIFVTKVEARAAPPLTANSTGTMTLLGALRLQ